MLDIHRYLFVEHPLASLALTTAVYVSVVLGFGMELAISSNYFVILPILTAALGYGLIGGLIAGGLGLPANLILFNILGRPDFAPASKLIADIFGLLVGGASGYLAEYYRRLQSEIDRRERSEESLRVALEDKQFLLLELHHRVKNNLNVIKSLVQLQRNRSEDARFREAADRLLARIFAIARVHDRLYGREDSAKVDPADYFRDILEVYDAEAGDGDPGPRMKADIRTEGRLFPADAAVSLGLVLNEAVANAWKYGVRSGETVWVSFHREEATWTLEVRDAGPGFDPGAGPPAGTPGHKAGALGVKIILGLAARLGGKAAWSREGGTL
ncbi:MAG TPA: sensor histidine kinase, partial [Magnetospirillaceae bacterium]|nr:sensor histidine kinase [Magnetospirillaceae bacterium]